MPVHSGPKQNDTTLGRMELQGAIGKAYGMDYQGQPAAGSSVMKVSATVLSAVLAATVLPLPSTSVVAATPAAQQCPAYLDKDFRKLHSSQSLNVCKAYPAKAVLVINTASNCGYTPQYKGLEALHTKYKDRGLVVVGFASNDFKQEAADEAKSAEICFLNNGVTFPVLADTKVTGAEANSVFKELNRQTAEPKWNFTKYLVAADGKVVKRFDSAVKPDSVEFTTELEKLLK
jgi:glutathione peroxidase